MLPVGPKNRGLNAFLGPEWILVRLRFQEPGVDIISKIMFKDAMLLLLLTLTLTTIREMNSPTTLRIFFNTKLMLRAKVNVEQLYMWLVWES